jgi:hypothetical protein
MGDEVKFKLHVDEFQRAADRLAAYSKRDGETFLKEQVRGFSFHLDSIRSLASIPPLP